MRIVEIKKKPVTIVFEPEEVERLQGLLGYLTDDYVVPIAEIIDEVNHEMVEFAFNELYDLNNLFTAEGY